MKKLFLLAVFLGAAAGLIAAQDFGFGPAEGDYGVSAPAVTVGGEVSAELQVFTGDLGSGSKIGGIEPGNIFSGALNFSAAAANAAGVINLKLKPDFETPENMLSLDEAYVSAFFGAFSLEAGLRKLTWGKADSFGPLDVINPLDYSDLSAMSDPQGIKLARPLLHGSLALGAFTKLEGVFVPWFAGDTFAMEAGDRWAPALATTLPNQMQGDFMALIPGSALSSLSTWLAGLGSLDAGTLSTPPGYLKTLKYFQAGLRFSTSAGSNDFGVQYYTGILTRPAVTLRYAEDIRNANPADLPTILGGIQSQITTMTDMVNIAYNRYHLIGLDYARVLFGFNLRAEAAARITSDLEGNDGAVYNPALLWSLGFDRDLLAGINLNLQVNETVVLLHDKITPNRAIDTEAGARVTSTRLTAVLSKKLFRDELELAARVIWGVEDRDCYLVPVITWTRGEASLECSGGIFAGNREGELGQYRDNAFVKTALSYSF